MTITSKLFGIDAGTTNSVISYATTNAKNQCVTRVADVIVPKGENNLSPERIIPSVVSYLEGMDNNSVIVGERAKKTFTEGRVVRSVKSLMGNTELVEGLKSDITDRTPAEITARILKCLTEKCKIKGEKDDVVVAVPASFPPAAINATKEAMRLAGIKTEAEHPVIISEPLAVLYSLWEEKLLDNIPEDVLSFEKDQNILVFDIGGGTTDVAIYSLKKSKSLLEMLKNCEQVSCSKHTPLAGDDFDNAIADYLYKDAVAQIGIVPKYPTIVKFVLKEYAENLKKQYTTYVYNEYDRSDADFDISINNLYDGHRYDNTLYMDDIEELVRPFLAEHLSIKDAVRANKLQDKDIKGNIIYPILDCLYKAYQKKGDSFRITSVVLNGGMTYFPMIKKRLDNFFDIDCINTLNGDESVAKGAAFFHYCMHAYGVSNNLVYETSEMTEITPVEILSDSLSIGLEGSYIARIADAGTPLPFKNVVADNILYMTKASNKIKLDIYSGEGEFKNLPCELAYRKIFQLNKKYPEGTPVSFRISIDALKQMTVTMCINYNNKEVYQMVTKAYGNIEKNDKEASGLIDNEYRAVLPQNDINYLSDLRKNQPIDYKKTCSKVLERLKNAPNKTDVCRMIVKKLKAETDLNNTIVGDLYNISLSCLEYFDDIQKKYVIDHAKSQFKKSNVTVLLKHNSYVKFVAMKLIYISGTEGQDFCREFLSDDKYRAYAISAFKDAADKPCTKDIISVD